MRQPSAGQGRLRRAASSTEPQPPASLPQGTLEDIYSALFAAYGPQGWWPTTLEPGGRPSYHGRPPGPAARFEIAVGAVLTQNTSWANVERAVMALHAAGLMEPVRLASAPEPLIQEAIRPSGYFRAKARKLLNLCAWWKAAVDGRGELRGAPGLDAARASLLAVNGVGPETADSILLYAFGLPTFVIDAYTRRVMSRAAGVPDGIGYEHLRSLFMAGLPADAPLFNEFHALLVEHAKRHCQKRSPVCSGCPLRLGALCPGFRAGRGAPARS